MSLSEEAKMKAFRKGGKYYKSNLHVALVLTEFAAGTCGVYALLALAMAIPV